METLKLKAFVILKLLSAFIYLMSLIKDKTNFKIWKKSGK